MIIKHIGADGRVRIVFEGVSSIHTHQSSSVVSVNRTAVAAEDPAIPSTLVRPWQSYEYPVALINLAPGESIERDDNEKPARS